MLVGISLRFLATVLPCCIQSVIGRSVLLAAPAPAPVPAPAAAPTAAHVFPMYQPVAAPPVSHNFPTAAPTGPLISNAAMIRGVDELAISESAMMSARTNGAAQFSLRQQLVAQQALEVAKEPYMKVTSLVPEAKAQVLQVRKYALRAAQYRDHTQKVEDEFHRLKQEAAVVASNAAAGWISADAAKTAERTVQTRAAHIAKKGDRIAAAVAEAAEPYHLALLRNQKFCAETYSKAKSAQESSLKLIADAKRLSLKAQELQASGMAIQAVESISMAKGMMVQAEDLRQWGTKLYNQANTACASAGGYVTEQQAAATAAAASTAVNEPMELPERF